MEILFSDEERAASKAEWAPRLHEYAAVTNAILKDSRRLPIYDQAVVRAAEWLEEALNHRVHRTSQQTLVLAGDEHLHAATLQRTLPHESLFVYRSAWQRWWSGIFPGEAPWWYEISWTINCPLWIIDLATSLADWNSQSDLPNRNLVLEPGRTFLCSEEVADRGTHTILNLEDDGSLKVEQFSEWLIS